MQLKDTKEIKKSICQLTIIRDKTYWMGLLDGLTG